jgi:hypothetical protein
MVPKKVQNIQSGGSKNLNISRSRVPKFPTSSKDKAERKQLIEAGRQRLKTMTNDSKDTDEWIRSYTGNKLPGTKLNEVCQGPIRASLVAAGKAKVLLGRNVLRGYRMMRSRVEKFDRDNDFSDSSINITNNKSGSGV